MLKHKTFASINNDIISNNVLIKRCKFSISQATSCTECKSGDSHHQLNRFAKGVKENCSTCLFLPDENCIVSKRFSEMTTQVTFFSQVI